MLANMAGTRTVDDVQKTFTTGQAARICDVAPRTVSKWVDTGILKGYRLPGSKDRRVPRDVLLAFLEDHGMPTNRLLSPPTLGATK